MVRKVQSLQRVTTTTSIAGIGDPSFAQKRLWAVSIERQSRGPRGTHRA